LSDKLITKPENHSLLIVGCVRNVESTIELELYKINQITDNFKNRKFLLIESDSKDKTINILNNIKTNKENFDFKTLGNLDKVYNFRTERIARCRMEYVNEINNNPKYFDVDLILVLDFDNINYLLTKKSILACFEKNGWDAVFANQKFAYYDIYALRHENWSPNDYRAQLDFLDKYRKDRFLNYWASAYSRMITIPENSEWIKVLSAFGGAALYKKDCFISNKYIGLINDKEVCEHIAFNQELSKRNKKLYICPAFINSGFNEHLKRLKFLYKIKFYFIVFISFFKKN
jgi:hypothetical protein